MQYNIKIHNISEHSVAEALFIVISWVKILTNQGSTFISCTLHELFKLLGVKLIVTSIYQTVQMDYLKGLIKP